MLIWVNGPFGGGKTQVAYELRRRLPGSVVCDPELVGFGLQRMTPPALRPDFQEFRAWRCGVVEVLDRALGGQAGHVIAPMTLVEPAYFDEIIGGLRHRGHLVHHVALLADREVVLHRLRSRAVGRSIAGWTHHRPMPRRESFAVANLDRCLDALAAPEFATQLRTDRLSVPQVADRVAGLADIILLPAEQRPARRRLQQTWTTVRHLRLR